jgi:hypothetical protein
VDSNRLVLFLMAQRENRLRANTSPSSAGDLPSDACVQHGVEQISVRDLELVEVPSVRVRTFRT